MSVDIRSALIGAGAAAIAVAVYGAYSLRGEETAQDGGKQPAEAATKPGGAAASPQSQSVTLSQQEFEKFNVQPARTHEFRIEREAVGNIDFNRDMSVDVFPPFAGKINTLYAKAGDDVEKGAILFTVNSNDLVQAESALISAAAAQNLTTRALERAKGLYEVQGVSARELEQATSDEQSAEGALRAARDALRIFGKSDADMDRIISERKVDSLLAVHSPISGRVTARNAAVGMLSQPGNGNAPYTVADISTMWMLASIPETDFPLVAIGQDCEVTLPAYPGRTFRGKIVNIGAAVDPNTRRVQVRSVVADPKHELRPGMFATFVIRTGKSVRSVAVPFGGIVREGDGTMSAWVSSGGGRLVKRTVKVGLQQDGFTQILDGLQPGEQIATDGALFLNNALTAASR